MQHFREREYCCAFGARCRDHLPGKYVCVPDTGIVKGQNNCGIAPHLFSERQGIGIGRNACEKSWHGDDGSRTAQSPCECADMGRISSRNFKLQILSSLKELPHLSPVI